MKGFLPGLWQSQQVPPRTAVDPRTVQPAKDLITEQATDNKPLQVAEAPDAPAEQSGSRAGEDAIPVLPISLRLDNVLDAQSKPRVLVCQIHVTIKNPAQRSSIVRDEEELTEAMVGRWLSASGIIQLAARRALRRNDEDIAANLEEELSEPLTMAGLSLRGAPKDVYVSRDGGPQAYLHTGQLIAQRWRLVRQLGKGAYGQVWLAYDTEMFDLECALKFIHQPHLARAIWHDGRRIAEAIRTQADLRHVARIIDVPDTAPPCLAYEYVAGPDLWQYVRARGGSLTMHQASTVCDQVLDGLSTLHRTGILHCNLHPGNLKLARMTPEPLIKILDVGLPWTAPVTGTRSLFSANPFLEPVHPFTEHAWQRNQQAPDTRTDLYSVGVLLWWLLTGQVGVPAGGDLEQWWPDGPPALLSVVRRSCSGIRAERFASAGDMRQALRTASAVRMAPAPPYRELPRPNGAILVRQDGTGDFEQVQDAVDQAPPGATLLLARGTHTITHPLRITRSLHMKGEGIDQTSIICEEPGAVIDVMADVDFVASDMTIAHLGDRQGDVVRVLSGTFDLQRCRFRGGVWDAKASDAGNGLAIGGMAQGTATECDMIGNLGHGIRVSDDAQVLLDGNTCRFNQGCGVAFLDQSGGLVHRNTCRDNVQDGIYSDQVARPELVDNTCAQNNGSGISYFGQTGGSASYNLCRENTQYGLYVDEHATPLVEGNACIANEWSGIGYYGHAAGTARANRCTGNYRYGILIAGSAFPHLEHNTCTQNQEAGAAFKGEAAGLMEATISTDNGQYGIYVDQHAHPQLRANHCAENAVSGIAYYGSAAGSAQHNECIRNGHHGIYVGEHAAPTLQANTCTENKRSGLALRDASQAIANENICTNNQVDGVHVAEQARPRLERNRCGHNDEAGIAFYGEAQGQVTGNTCHGNGQSGIWVGKAARPSLEENVCTANDWSGIAFNGQASGMVARNTCTQNTQYGIYVDDEAKPVLLENCCLENAWSGIAFFGHATGAVRRNTARANGDCGIYVARTARPELGENTAQGNHGPAVQRD